MKIFQYIDFQDKLWVKTLLCKPEVICEIEAESISEADAIFEQQWTPTLNGKKCKVSGVPIGVSILEKATGAKFQTPPYSAKILDRHLIGLPHPVINWWEVGLSADDKLDLCHPSNK